MCFRFGLLWREGAQFLLRTQESSVLGTNINGGNVLRPVLCLFLARVSCHTISPELIMTNNLFDGAVFFHAVTCVMLHSGLKIPTPASLHLAPVTFPNISKSLHDFVLTTTT